MKAYERFITYVKTHTASSETSESVPSSDCQFTLCHMLADEMRALGLEGVYEDEHAYVYGFIPASEGYEDKPCIGFIAHLDTIPDFPGENVQPQLIENYDGGNVVLGTSGRSLTVEKFPHLPSLKGQTLITTDGTTVLGADDKAGIAAIMTAAERIINEKRPHGRVAVCFTPDEEIGHGAALLDLERLGADFAYTVDGEELSEINYETFNAASAKWEVNGFNIHPGSAKNMMINASLVAMEINSMLPSGDTPAHTEGYEGFYHVTDLAGNESQVVLHAIIRDHDLEKFNARKAFVERLTAYLNDQWGQGTFRLDMKDSYYNMKEKIRPHMELIENAKAAMEAVGVEPVIVPIRGGTDGARLSWERNIPCPNLCTGGANFHGVHEFIPVPSMEKMVQVLVELVKA